MPLVFSLSQVKNRTPVLDLKGNIKEKAVSFSRNIPQYLVKEGETALINTLKLET